jgi:hypothetical protein
MQENAQIPYYGLLVPYFFRFGIWGGADELQNFNFQIYGFFAQPAESVRCN